MQNQVDTLEIKLGEAKKKKYLKSRFIHDPSQILYELQCERDNIPFVHVHEHKEGHATLTVMLPHNKELSYQTREDIANMAGCIDIYPTTNDYSLGMKMRVRAKDIRSFVSIPTENAILFAEKIVDVLTRKGMFLVK
jgi:hypothetical protein